MELLTPQVCKIVLMNECSEHFKEKDCQVSPRKVVRN